MGDALKIHLHNKNPNDATVDEANFGSFKGREGSIEGEADGAMGGPPSLSRVSRIAVLIIGYRTDRREERTILIRTFFGGFVCEWFGNRTGSGGRRFERKCAFSLISDANIDDYIIGLANFLRRTSKKRMSDSHPSHEAAELLVDNRGCTNSDYTPQTLEGFSATVATRSSPIPADNLPHVPLRNSPTSSSPPPPPSLSSSSISSLNLNAINDWPGAYRRSVENL
ncbi:hypothetical protein GWI33_019691 [Rhynchophorus ferrugineus]|uniref:Uncharacterized protein n=1 Tax=Rhynchophorus ferrugineus TaxID=354439 RepID=A0A834HT72_RHYFE|nr:hypothetical protein GWI33_019691 [Rhynchophorus ferrugineus]